MNKHKQSLKWYKDNAEYQEQKILRQKGYNVFEVSYPDGKKEILFASDIRKVFHKAKPDLVTKFAHHLDNLLKYSIVGITTIILSTALLYIGREYFEISLLILAPIGNVFGFIVKFILYNVLGLFKEK